MKRVLIIDDEEDLCLLLKSYLSRRSFDVQVAFELQEGIRKAQDFKPDLLFLDNNMPDGQGWEKAGWFLEALPQTRIILMSAFKPANPLPGNQRINILEKPISFQSVDDML